MKNIRAFTLVELIVVITILAVLGTIAFVSFQGYAVSSRDSARLSNLKVTQKALQYYFIENAIYPEPSNGVAITFSGAEVWTQGTIGESVVQQIKRLTSVPKDPLTGSEMTYSRLNTKGEIELATTFERGLTLNQTSNVHAGDAQGIAYIVGDYNGLVAKVSTGSSVYVLAVPSIINGDISVDDYTALMGSNKLAVQGKNVIPHSYTGTTFDSDNTYDLGITNLVVYSGSTLPTTQTQLNNFVTTLQDTYSGSTIQDVSEIGVLVQTTDANDLLVLGSGLLQNSLGGKSVELVAGSSNPPANNYKTVNDCTASGNIVYGTETGNATGLTCDQDIIVCTGVATGITVAACNAGATTVYNSQTFSSASASRNATVNEWAGGLYQWGNSADISYAPSTSSTVTSTTGDSTFSNATFISTSSSEWQSPINYNLWGATTNTNEARIGPCREGYHVPTASELTALRTARSWGSGGSLLKSLLRMPYAGSRSQSGVSNQGNFAYYRASDRQNSQYGYMLLFHDSLLTRTGQYPSASASVRCFKN